MTCCSSAHSPKKRLNRRGKRVINKACLTEGARIKIPRFYRIADWGRWGKKGLHLFYSSQVFKNDGKYCCFLRSIPFLSPLLQFWTKTLSWKLCLWITTLIANSVKGTCFDSSSMFLWHPEHNRDHPQHLSKSSCHVIQYSVCQASVTYGREVGRWLLFSG